MLRSARSQYDEAFETFAHPAANEFSKYFVAGLQRTCLPPHHRNSPVQASVGEFDGADIGIATGNGFDVEPG